MKKYSLNQILFFFLFLGILGLALPHQASSIPSKNVKDVLSSSQFSYYGGVASGNAEGGSILTINTADFPSRTSNNLFVGDTISIGVGGKQSLYTVRDIGATNQILVNPALTADAAAVGGSIIATRSAIHTVSFEPQSSAVGGAWRVLIKAPSGSIENASDGIPDQGGFDSYHLNAAAVTCPWGASASVGTTMAGGKSGVPDGNYYHVISCNMGAGGTNPVGTGETGVIIIGNETNMLINPSSTHTSTNPEGNANVFNFILQRTDASDNVIEESPGRIAVVEAVRVTATIDPTLSFYIDNVGVTDVSSTACGVGTTLSNGAAFTTGDRVVFGSLELGVHNQLAQRLSCVTNAPGGYVVTAYEAGVMKNINTDTTIPDTTCNGTGCTPTTATAWDGVSSTLSEFGYTVTSLGATTAFSSPNFKPFGIGYANAQPIMLNTKTPLTTESANVCYRITATTTQEAGDYEAKVIYTATATF